MIYHTKDIIQLKPYSDIENFLARPPRARILTDSLWSPGAVQQPRNKHSSKSENFSCQVSQF
jgi:hypothetical protein